MLASRALLRGASARRWFAAGPCRFPTPATSAHLEPETRARLDEVEEKAGFVPNISRALWRRPKERDAFWAYHDVVMAGSDELSKADRELIVVATSGENRCNYCVVAHGAIARILTRDPLLPDQLANNFRTADVTPREAAMLRFAVKVSRNAEAIDDADYAAVAAAGFSEEAAWDIAAVASFFAMSNRLANAISLKPNPEFYAMGRAKRE